MAARTSVVIVPDVPCDDQPVDTEIHERGHRAFPGPGARGGVAENHPKVLFTEHALQPVEQVHEPGVGQVVEENTDNAVRPLASQRAALLGR